MDTYQLQKPDGTPAGVWACGKCGKVYHQEEIAELCCKPRICSVEGCEDECPTGYTVCERHRRELELERARKRWEAAVDDPKPEHEPVWCDHTDTFHHSLESWAEDVAEEYPCGIRRYIEQFGHVYCCKQIMFHLDADDIVQAELEHRHHEDAEVPVRQINALQKLLNEWCEGQGVVSYEADYTRRVPREQLLAQFSAKELEDADDGA